VSGGGRSGSEGLCHGIYQGKEGVFRVGYIWVRVKMGFVWTIPRKEVSLASDHYNANGGIFSPCHFFDRMGNK